jgi:outer membrane protein OmpA-like peptidoglycan-associated protein
MRLLFFIIYFLLGIVSINAQSINAMALRNGCRIISNTSSYYTSNPTTAKIDDWTTRALLDENPGKGWCSAQYKVRNNEFLFELSEHFDLTELIFDNTCQVEYKGICAKNISVSFSSESYSSGFGNEQSYILPQYQSGISYKIDIKNIRWIKLTIKDNYGHPEWTELMEMKVMGTYTKSDFPSSSNATGVWNTNFDWVSIKSNANGTFYGCYKWAQGELYPGKVERNVYSFEWYQKGDGQRGWCVFVLNEDGNRMNGIWGFGNNQSVFGYWEFIKKQSTPYACSNDDVMQNKSYNTASKKIDPSITKLNLVIEIVDLSTGKNIPGTIELSMPARSYQVPSGDGIYSADIDPNPRLAVKSALPNYFPRIDSIEITSQELEKKYAYRKIELQKLETGKSIILKNVLFYQSKAVMIPESYNELDQLVALMHQYPNMVIELSGHTDNQGDYKKNIILSEDRVATVKQYLVSKGISEERIVGIGYGPKYPVASNYSEITRRLNRRVEFKILKF